MFRPRFLIPFLVAVLGAATPASRAAGGIPGLPARVAWQAVPDSVYLQEHGRQVPHGEPLTGVVATGEGVWVGTARGILRLEGTRCVEEPGVRGTVRRLLQVEGRAWALTAEGAFRRDPGGWVRVGTRPVTDLTAYRGSLVGASGNRLWRLEGGDWVPMGTNTARFELRRVTVHQEMLYVLGDGRLAPCAADRFGGFDAYGFASDQAWDWGALPSPVTREFLGLGPRLLIATDRGLGVLRGMSLTALRGADGLPQEDVTCLAAGFTNDCWMGTRHGLVRQVDGRFEYLAGRRWLPSDQVNGVAVQGRTVLAATDGGLGIIEYRPYTLAKKAAYYERHLEAWGQKRLGFTHKLEWDEPTKEFVREISDNDGGYTGDYLAAQAYRWAVTGEPDARREATNTFHALRWLEGMTGIPGFPARSVWAKGERGHQAGHGSGGYAAEWHDTADGRFEWKGDTSSDELCSHFYAVTVFLELAARGEEIEQGRRHLARIADHLIRHRWRLVDLDGQPTRWGRWDPEYFRTEEGLYDRALQALELLSFIKTAEVLTGEPRFAGAYRELVALGYPGFTLRARNTFPPDSVLHFLDQLAFWSWWTLLRYEQDPDLKALYRRGFERSFEVVRVEHNPWFNFVYGVLTGNDCEPDRALDHLRAWPLDLRVWSYRNSHRTDLRTPPGYVALKGGTQAFAPREHEPMRWDAWTMRADGGAGGRDVVEPGGWLVAYWMARYHGFLEAPRVGDPALLTVTDGEIPPGGARPYDGPGRPPGW